MCLWVRKTEIDPELYWNEHERMGLYLHLQGKKTTQMRGCDGKPLVHHYSWVRTQEEMVKKFGSWGHFWERDWQQLIEEEYNRPFNGSDFIRKYRYQEVDPFFDPLQITPITVDPIGLSEHLVHIRYMDNVKRVSQKEMFQKELDQLCK